MTQGSFDEYTVGAAGERPTTLCAGERRAFVAVHTVAVACSIARKPWPVRRAPGDEPAGEASLGAS